jgi:anti-sigma-K factor RskA
MNMNLRRNSKGAPTDTEIERDVAELRRLLAGVDGPKEPHPAYWQNFVVRVRGRIDEEGVRRKRLNFSTAWASVGAATLVVIVAISSGLFEQGTQSLVPDKDVVSIPAPEAQLDLAASYDATGTTGLVLTNDDMEMINAIVSDNQDEAVFEALVDSDL